MSLNSWISWTKYFFSKHPFYLIFYITSRCNAKCSHCFNWQLIEDKKNENELTLAEIEQIAKNWGRMLIVNLAGGEPFLRTDIADIVKIFRKYTGVEIITSPSNGFMTDQTVYSINKMLTDSPDVFFRFYFSIDGIGEEHDKIRGVPGGFEKVLKTVEEIIKLKQKYKNFNVYTSSCFMNSNQDKLQDTLKFLIKNLEVDDHYVTFIRSDVKCMEEREGLSIDKYKEIVRFLEKAREQRASSHPLSKTIKAVSAYTRDKVLENLTTNKRNFDCYAISKMLVLTPTGEVKICEMLPVSLGNLREHNYNIKEIVNSDFARTEYKKIKNRLCNCTWECAIQSGIIYNPKEYLPLIKYILKI